MIRNVFLALLLLGICSHFPTNAEESDFRAKFKSPPAENRILKIIHTWPDKPADQDELIRSLSSQGFGGVVCNVSFTEYLQSKAKWGAFVRATEQAKAAGFSLWLYDEKGYPSGTAGGLVLREHPEWEARGLLIADSVVKDKPIELVIPPGQLKLAGAFRVSDGNHRLTVATNLSTRVVNGKLAWTPPEGKWHVYAITEARLYEGTHAAGNLADHIPYPNLLDPEPTKRFLALTHEAYAVNLGPNLGRYFRATFTDEPSLMSLFLRPMPYRVLPWSKGLESTFRQQHGYSIEPALPALISDVGSETARVRYDYWNTVGSMVSANFFGQIQDWCRQHQVLSGGHLLMEENLVNQVPLYGDFFRCLRRLDSPGIDCLTSLPEQVPWYIARLASSAAELEDKTVTMCETSDHSQRYRPPGDKRAIRTVSEAEIRGTCNRLMVSGIDAITSYYSFDGLDTEQLKRLNGYVGRCCFALQGGSQVSDIAVLYPVESVWIKFTPARHYANDSPRAASIENVFRDISESLFSNGRDFSYVDGRALSEARVENGMLVHGQLRWRMVILPCTDTLPIKAWQNLSDFVASGGVVLSIGALPVNSETEFPSPKAQLLGKSMFGAAQDMPFTLANKSGGAGIFLPAGLASLTPEVISKIFGRDLAPSGAGTLRYTHRRFPSGEVYFVINDSKEPWKGEVDLCVQGPGEQMDPMTGLRTQLAGGTRVQMQLPAYGGMLFKFAKARQPQKFPISTTALPAFTTRTVPDTQPTIARGEFVDGTLVKTQGVVKGSAATPSLPMWQAAASLKKSDVDTFLFLSFVYKEPINLKASRALMLDSWVPEGQHAPTQLLLILHEASGADYLAHTGRMLSSEGPEQSWIALDRFQLAGWSQDPNSRLDLDQITAIRVGWGGYFGQENESITFCVATPVFAQTAEAGNQTIPTNSPSGVDLRPVFERFGLAQRLQAGRPTCSVFTVVGALEFAIAKGAGQTNRLSIDFLNWSANQICGETQDGGFFSDLWSGFEKFGICCEAQMPYQPSFEPQRSPAPETLEAARTALREDLSLHWIKRWNVKTGLSESEFARVKQTLVEGWPVCGGFRWPVRERWEKGVLQMCEPTAVRDGHSVLLVGFRDDPNQPGGGVFIFRNSGGQGHDGYMPYAYAIEYMNDAVWVGDASTKALPSDKS